jgi:hypothetical protein
MPAEQADALTYATATPEQVAQARQEARERLRHATDHWTPERVEQAYVDHDRRLRDTAR